MAMTIKTGPISRAISLDVCIAPLLQFKAQSRAEAGFDPNAASPELTFNEAGAPLDDFMRFSPAPSNLSHVKRNLIEHKFDRVRWQKTPACQKDRLINIAKA